jgi:hypothetical protein
MSGYIRFSQKMFYFCHASIVNKCRQSSITSASVPLNSDGFSTALTTSIESDSTTSDRVPNCSANWRPTNNADASIEVNAQEQIQNVMNISKKDVRMMYISTFYNFQIKSSLRIENLTDKSNWE